MELQAIVDDIVGFGRVPYESEFVCVDVELIGNQCTGEIDDCGKHAGSLLNGNVFVHVNSHLINEHLDVVDQWRDTDLLRL